LLNETVLKDVLKQGSVVPWLEKVAICAEACVADAFETEGDGQWLPWLSPSYENNSGQLLDDTGQLKRSITSEVKG
jgi:phage gpG-like protein